jgi:hypothetical protein
MASYFFCFVGEHLYLQALFALLIITTRVLPQFSCAKHALEAIALMHTQSRGQLASSFYSM